MNLKNKKISYGLLVLFLAVFAWYFFSNREDFQFLSNIQPMFIIIIGVGHLLTVYANGLLLNWLLEPYNKKLSEYDSFYISLISSIGNFFLPVGSGLALRAVYLKQKVGLSFKDFSTTIYGSYIILFLCYGIAGLLSLIMLSGRAHGPAFYTLLSVFAGIVLFTLYLSFFEVPRNLLKSLQRILPGVTKKIVEVIKGWNEVIKHRGLMLRLFIVTVSWYLLSLAINYASIKAIGASIDIWPLMLLSAMSALSLLINITPGSIGIREGLFVFSSSLLGLTVPQILAASLLERTTKGAALVITWFVLSLKEMKTLFRKPN